jgi:threonine synthase
MVMYPDFQIVHYIYCYFRCRKSVDGKVRIVVPTGACGNISGNFHPRFTFSFINKLFFITFKAGFVARKMGFNIELISVVNPNDIVHRTFAKGDFSMKSEVQSTWASAMDIQVKLAHYINI